MRLLIYNVYENFNTNIDLVVKKAIPLLKEVFVIVMLFYLKVIVILYFIYPKTFFACNKHSIFCCPGVLENFGMDPQISKGFKAFLTMHSGGPRILL